MRENAWQYLLVVWVKQYLRAQSACPLSECTEEQRSLPCPSTSAPSADRLWLDLLKWFPWAGKCFLSSSCVPGLGPGTQHKADEASTLEELMFLKFSVFCSLHTFYHLSSGLYSFTHSFNMYFLRPLTFSSVQFSHSVMSDSLLPYPVDCSTPGLPVHHQLPPGVYSNSCPLSWWCHPTISSSVVPFFSRLQSFPASGSYQTSQLFTSGGQSIGVSASACAGS